MPTTRFIPSVAGRKQLAAVKSAIKGYHLALDRREHGEDAAHKAIEEIENILGMRWYAEGSD